MALVIPWLLVREYQQHRNALADQLSRVTGWRVVKVVIHPGELEEWARRQERAVSAQVRSRLNGVSADHVGYASGHHCLICWVLRHGAHPVDVRPHHWAHLRQGFLKDCLLLRGFILDAGISQDWPLDLTDALNTRSTGDAGLGSQARAVSRWAYRLGEASSRA